jgi:hypothetical protein
MNGFGPYLATIHLQDLLDDAALQRRARLARKGHAGVPAWRRSLGGLFVTAARTIDPSVATPTPSRTGKRPGARAMAT